jgi:hypothetical protein
METPKQQLGVAVFSDHYFTTISEEEYHAQLAKKRLSTEALFNTHL